MMRDLGSDGAEDSAHPTNLVARRAPLFGRDGAVRRLAELFANARRGETLLVADDAEQLLAWASETFGAWLDAAPELRLLVTSRARLGLKGEVRMDVEPLELDEALDL